LLYPSGNTGRDPAPARARGTGGSAALTRRLTHTRTCIRPPLSNPCCLLHPAWHTSETERGGYDRGAPSRGATARLMGAREPAWRRCAAGRVQQAAATTTAAKMVAVVLALLKVRTAVIAARDGGGGESMAVRGVAVAAVSGARRVAHLGRRVATRRAAARERQHTSGSMPNACASGDDASAGGASRGGVPGGAAMGYGGRQRRCGGKAAVREGSGSSRRGQAVCARRVCTQRLWPATDLPYLCSSG